MRFARNLATALSVLLLASSASANGGGYAFGVKFSGNLAPFQAAGTQHVRIEDEVLDVVLRRSAAAVVVRYTMANASEKPVRVRFGFPVEAPRADEYEAGPRPSRDELLAGIHQLEGYRVALNGAPVAARYEIEPFAAGLVKPFPGSEALAGVAGWMVSEVTFPPSSSSSLEIRYTARYQGADTWVSDDQSLGPLSFSYRLSTGAVWRGTIGHGIVTVRADGVVADEVELLAPLERFRREGDRWIWEFHDLEPSLADDLKVQAVPGLDREWNYGASEGVLLFLQRKGAWAAGHQGFTAKASSTLRPNAAHGFEAGRLAETSPEAPWCEGVAGDGVGAWVELAPLRPAPLLGLDVTPGFAMRGVSLQDRLGHGDLPVAFGQNGVPTRVEVTLNGEFRFSASLDPLPVNQFIPILGYAKPVSRIRLTVEEVRRGARYQDTCLSRVVLYDRLAAEPARHGAR